MNGRRMVPWSMMLIGLAAVSLRGVGLFERGLWFDEAMSWRTVILPWPEMMASIGDNTHAPLFFCLLKVWVSLFGESLASLRSFNVAVTLAILVVLDRWLADAAGAVSPVTRRLACGLFAVSPLQIGVAGEVRMYPLFVLFAIASTWALWRLCRGDRGWGWWSAYVLASLAMLYTHYFALFLVAAQISYVLGMGLSATRGGADAERGSPSGVGVMPVRGMGLLGGLVPAWAAIGVGWLPWVSTFWRQQRRVAAGWWTGDFTADAGLRVITSWVGVDVLAGRLPWSVGGGFALVAGTLVAALAWGGRVGRLAAWLSLVSTLLVMGSSASGTNVAVARYFAASQALWLVALAALIARIPARRLRRGLAMAVVALFVSIQVAEGWLDKRSPSVTALGRTLGLGHGGGLGAAEPTGVRGAVAFMESRRRPGEPMLVDSSFLYFPAAFHAERRDQIRLIDGPSGLSFYTGGPVIRRSDRVTSEELGRLSADRVWLLSGSIPQSHPMPARWMVEHQTFFYGPAPFQEWLRVTSYVPRRDVGADLELRRVR